VVQRYGCSSLQDPTPIHWLWPAGSVWRSADAGPPGWSVRVALEEVLEPGEGAFGFSLVASPGVDEVDDATELAGGEFVFDLKIEPAPEGGGRDCWRIRILLSPGPVAR
jgi:hypothetical protein